MGLTFSIMVVNLHRIHKFKKDVLIKNEYIKINSKSPNVIYTSQVNVTGVNFII